jgi:catechol 2,3-dioxygenase-like lactoylglutathione lyase family enzyme
VTSGKRAYFDHVAIAVERWSDGYPLFVTSLGGDWMGGGSTEEFAPAQIGFGGGLRVELLQPGNNANGFVTRFLEKDGSGPHHLTFMVPRLDEFVATATRYGLRVLGAFLEVPERPEAFVHPKGNGFGTLLQAIQFSELGPDPSPPHGFPESGLRKHQISWVAVRVADLQRATDFLVEATDATVDRSKTGTRSVLLEWRDHRRLLLLDGSGGGVGVDHIAFHPQDAAPPSPLSVLAEARDIEIVDAPGIRIIVSR